MWHMCPARAAHSCPAAWRASRRGQADLGRGAFARSRAALAGEPGRVAPQAEPARGARGARTAPACSRHLTATTGRVAADGAPFRARPGSGLEMMISPGPPSGWCMINTRTYERSSVDAETRRHARCLLPRRPDPEAVVGRCPASSSQLLWQRDGRRKRHWLRCSERRRRLRGVAVCIRHGLRVGGGR